jgi:hypothetical protein
MLQRRSEIARLKTLTITQIVRQFESLFGEKCRSRNKRYLIRRIAWRLQANAEGDLSERAKARAAELALDSEVRVSVPKPLSDRELILHFLGRTVNGFRKHSSRANQCSSTLIPPAPCSRQREKGSQAFVARLGPALATSRLDASSRLQGPADPRTDRQQRIRVLWVRPEAIGLRPEF